MRIMLISTAALLISTVTASAESFTFSGTRQVTNQITAPTRDGRTVTTTFVTISDEITWSPQQKSSLSGVCASKPTRAAADAPTTGVCLLSEADGEFSVTFTCAAPNEQSKAVCSGQATGTSGRYQGKTGTVSWEDTLNADRTPRAAAGSGQWN